MIDKEMLEIEEKLQDIENNTPVEFLLGKNKYKISRLCNWTMTKIMRLTISLQKKHVESSEDVYDSFEDREIVPKIVSLAILKRPWKIKLFHSLHWRMLNRKYGQADFYPIISILIGNSDMRFFSQNLVYLHLAAKMETKIAKESITSIAAEQQSDQETK